MALAVAQVADTGSGNGCGGTSASGPLFYVTNSTGVITLSVAAWETPASLLYVHQSFRLLAYMCVERLVTVGSVITLTQAGLPDCRALSMAGAISSSLVTNSP